MGTVLVSGDESPVVSVTTNLSGSSGSLTAQVDRVELTDHFTKVEVMVKNAGSSTLELPLYSNCTLLGVDGTVLQADDFKSSWSTSVPPGGHAQMGTITFPDHLPAGVNSARLTFAIIYGTFGAHDLSVDDVPVPSEP